MSKHNPKICCNKDNSRKSKTAHKKEEGALTEAQIVKKTKAEFKKICEMAISFDICYCYLCERPIRKWQRWNLDHVRPASRGGKTEFANLRPVHYDCNQAKSDMDLEQFRYVQELSNQGRQK